jgi:hypothetical protein
MQFFDYDTNRDLKIHLSSLSNVAYGQVSAADPVTVTLYLPALDDRPQPLRYKELNFGITGAETSPRFLDFHSGFIVSNPNSDLRFDFVHEPSMYHAGSDDQRLKVTALRGAGIVQVPSTLTSDLSVPIYEQMMLIAPSSGYSYQAIISGGWIYYRSADGTFYARLEVEGFTQGDGSGNIMLQYWANPTGSRNLLFDPSLQIK